MRKVLFSLMVLSLVPALAGAAISNPDGFEGYALTTDWIPTVIGEGWIRYGETGDPAEGNSVEIADGSLAGNTTQVLKMDSGTNGENLAYEWYANVADADVPLTKTSFDFAATEILFGSEYRLNVARVGIGTWPGYASWSIMVAYGSWWGGGPGIPYAKLQTWDHNEPGDIAVFNNEDILGAFDEITGDFEPGNEVWYAVEVEEDNVLSKTRVRIYDKSTSPGAEEGWTSWLAHNSSEQGLDFATGGKVWSYTNGVAEWDNFSMTEEPVVTCNPGDANNDTLVSADDYASVQGAFGNTGAIGIPGDANCDGLVSADDYASVQGNFGATYGGAPIPEPATIGLLAIGGLAMLRRSSAQVLRRRRS